jgi:hypothetical protein
MLRPRSIARSTAAAILGAVALAACAEPPTREIAQAQGALEAARAAGAETYARTEFQAADEALRRAHTAVADRDYRQALSFALDAREQARAAAREAAAARGRAAASVAQAIQQAARGLEAFRGRVTGPGSTRDQRARYPARLDELMAQLQEARSAVAAGDYARAAERARTVQTRVDALAAELPKPRAGSTPR